MKHSDDNLVDFCIKTKMANSKMITGNPIQKIIQLTPIFNESLWSCSNITIRLIHQFPLGR